MSVIARLLISCLVVTLAVSLTFAPAFAVDKLWDNGGATSFWDDDDNWDPDEKPQPADKAIVGGNPEVNTLEIFDELENTGTINITTGTLQPQGDTTNTGTINIGDGSAINSQLIIGNSTTLSGSGDVVLRNSDGLPGSNAVLRGGTSAELAVTNGAGHTVRGEGSIIQHWINEGVVRAEETSGNSSAVLRLDGSSFVNNGELRSSSGASINFHFLTYSQGAGGQLVADTDNITLTGITSVTGGSLDRTGGGVFDTNGLITLSGVTINAPIDNSNTSGAINDARLYIDGDITNNSTITIEGTTARNSLFGFTSSGTLDGNGEVVLAGGNTQTFIGVFPGSPAEFTQAAGHTIRGAGSINGPIINNGTIRAESGTDSVTLTIQSVQTNNSRIEASAGATLFFTGGLFGGSQVTQGSGGVIAALDGGTVELNGSAITGGSLDTVGSGQITLTNNPTLTDVTNLGTFNAPGGRAIRIAGSAFTNDGVVTLNSTNSNSIGQLIYTSDITLAGAGEVVVQSAANPSRVVPFGGDHTLTNGADHTIRGFGFMSGTIVNQGKLEGNSAAEPLTIFADLSGDGPLENVQISGSVFSGFSIHSPGNSTAVVSLEGNYEITSAGTLAVELGGISPGDEHDQLSSTGTVDIDGGLIVSLIDLENGYTPTAGDRFDIITSANNDITGTFRNNLVELPEFALSHILSWEPIDYSDPRKVTLELASAIAYDVDRDDDGDVDGLDLLILQREDPSLIPAWEFEYGGGSPLIANSRAVPEPMSCELVAIALLTCTAIRRTTA